ncbi:MAG: thioredoxin family protein [Bacteroidota bacterium]
MRKNSLVFCLLFLLPIFIFAQKTNRHVIDPKKQKDMLLGKCNRHGLETEPFNEWFQKEYSDYKPDAQILDQLKNQMKGVKIILIMGTWCSDSRREVPRFYKILDYLKVKSKKMKVICVDRDKKAGDLSLEKLKFTLIPTFVIYKNDKELGRIIESPLESLEKDLLKIITAN